MYDDIEYYDYSVPSKKYTVNYYKKKVGKDNKKATVNKDQAEYIRSMKGKARQVDLADEFKISQGMVSHIQNNKYWKHQVNE